MQVGFVISIVTWVLLFAGSNADKWFAPGQVFGAMILFCLTTYLGVYVMSLFLRKAAFAIAIGIHLLLLILYLVGVSHKNLFFQCNAESYIYTVYYHPIRKPSL